MSGEGTSKQDLGQSQVIVPLVHGEAIVDSSVPALLAKPDYTRRWARPKPKLECESLRNQAAILVGLAEMTVGQSIPEVNLRGEEVICNRLSFFWGQSVRKSSDLVVRHPTTNQSHCRT